MSDTTPMMMDDELRERLARALAREYCQEMGEGWEFHYDNDPGGWESMVDAIEADLRTAGYTITKRIPHEGRTDA